ncbi:hypothetical protein BU16DRAFT_584853 [Lophium mytilinum]|uniref:Uncharacterized protein n=1 Tax=Lophium mytilinum TaxID=390894 RepID=A0A6A6QI25_9PEZI|nr:hypothetical protein BU16DRAFT_584853 [Lophium mytilinum]
MGCSAGGASKRVCAECHGWSAGGSRTAISKLYGWEVINNRQLRMIWEEEVGVMDHGVLVVDQNGPVSNVMGGVLVVDQKAHALKWNGWSAGGGSTPTAKNAMGAVLVDQNEIIGDLMGGGDQIHTSSIAMEGVVVGIKLCNRSRSMGGVVVVGNQTLKQHMLYGWSSGRCESNLLRRGRHGRRGVGVFKDMGRTFYGVEVQAGGGSTPPGKNPDGRRLGVGVQQSSFRPAMELGGVVRDFCDYDVEHRVSVSNDNFEKRRGMYDTVSLERININLPSALTKSNTVRDDKY